MRMRSIGIRRLAGLALCALVAGCGPLISFGESGPAPVLYSLEYGGVPKDQSIGGPIVAVSTPDLLPRLEGQNIAVVLPGNEHTTLGGAEWSGHIGDMVQDYVMRALSSETSGTFVGRASLDVSVECRLGIKLWAMDYVPGDRARDDKVVVSLQMILVRMADSSLLGQQVFTHEATPSTNSPRAIAAAFNEAMMNNAQAYQAWFSAKGSACK